MLQSLRIIQGITSTNIWHQIVSNQWVKQDPYFGGFSYETIAYEDLYSAPSTCIRIFLNPQIYLCGFENLSFRYFRIECGCPHISGFTPVTMTSPWILSRKHATFGVTNSPFFHFVNKYFTIDAESFLVFCGFRFVHQTSKKTSECQNAVWHSYSLAVHPFLDLK